MTTPAYEAMNRRGLVEAVQEHNQKVQVIRSYSRKSKSELLQELRRVYPLTPPSPVATKSAPAGKRKPKNKKKGDSKAKTEPEASPPIDLTASP